MIQKQKKVVRFLIYAAIGIAYIQASVFMAHYYVDTHLDENPSVINKILLEPIERASVLLPPPRDEVSGTIVSDDQWFFVDFFVWPVLLITALLYWVMLFVVLVILVVFMSIGLVLSYVLKFLIFVITSYSIF